MGLDVYLYKEETLYECNALRMSIGLQKLLKWKDEWTLNLEFIFIAAFIGRAAILT